MNYQDIKAAFPGVYSVGGDIIARINGEAVTVANYIGGAFILTKKGETLKAEPVVVEKTATRRGRQAKEQVAEPVEPPELAAELDAILAE